MLIEKLKSYAGDVIFKRGIAYYNQGSIKKFKVTPLASKQHQIQAVVQGTKSYSVNITIRIIDDKMRIDNYCTCPYDWGELCKHEVAVLYKFLVEEYHELDPAAPRKPNHNDGYETFKRLIHKATPKLESIKYELKGLRKTSGSNFRLSLSASGLNQQILKTLVEEMSHSHDGLTLSERFLNYFTSFDRLVLEHLNKIYTRKDAGNCAVYIAKSFENLEFLRTLIATREVFIDGIAKPLELGETIKPKILVEGSESHLRIRRDISSFTNDGYYHPELDCVLKENTLHLIDMSLVDELPGELEIPPQKTGELLFDILPKLGQKFPLELPASLTSHQLHLIEPQIGLSFDYANGQILCQAQIKINDQVYLDKDCLKLASMESQYSPSATEEKTWVTINPASLQFFLDFLERNNFTVSPEGLTIKEPDHLFQFMLTVQEELPPQWQINTTPAFNEFKVDPLKLEPMVELDLSNEIDWFEFKIYYSLGGKTYTHQEITKMIRQTASGKKYIQTGEQYFLLDETSDKFDLVEKNLRETSPKQEQTRKELYNLLYFRQVFQQAGINVKGNAVYNQLDADISGLNLVDPYQVPTTLSGELRHYQKEGFYWLRFLHKYRLGGILADDMGLGKTIQVLTLIKSILLTAPALVVCPRSLIYNWAAEIDKFYPGTPYLVYHGTPEERGLMRQGFLANEIIITTYDIFARDAEILQEINFEYCILDEAQHIKNHQTLRAKEVKKVKARHKLVMTGTPIENRLEELWSIFDFLMPGYLESQQKFVARYVNPLKKAGAPDTLKLLKQKVAPFILRRRKEEVLTELPEKIISLQNVFMSKLQEDTYRTVLDDLKEDILQAVNAKGLQKSGFTVLAALTKLRQICNHPALVLPESVEAESGKLETLLELIDEAIDGGHKIVVFSQFVKMLKLISTKFNEKKISYEYLDGSTRDRMERINRFNETPSIAVFLISLKAGGVGINLTAADIVIHVDPWWNPMTENQATDRVHRMGQKNQVMVYKLITKGTVEEKILQLQKRKKSVFDAIIESNQSPVTTLTWEDVKDLFEL